MVVLHLLILRTHESNHTYEKSELRSNHDKQRPMPRGF